MPDQIAPPPETVAEIMHLAHNAAELYEEFMRAASMTETRDKANALANATNALRDVATALATRCDRWEAEVTKLQARILELDGENRDSDAKIK